MQIQQERLEQERLEQERSATIAGFPVEAARSAESIETDRGSIRVSTAQTFERRVLVVAANLLVARA